MGMTIYQGDAASVNVTIVDEAGSVVDVSSWTLAARVGSVTTENIGAGTVTDVDAANGVVNVALATALTSQLRPNVGYKLQLRRTDSGAESTLLSVDLIVKNSLFI